MAKRYLKVSEEKPTDLALLQTSDLTLKDLELVEKFKENGMLGLHTLGPTDVERCMALYMDNQTYRQIARITHIKKDVILFLSHKFKWWEMKKEYLDELNATMKDKVVESKLQSQEFLLKVLLAYQKKISRNIDKYLKTDDETWADKIDSKDLSALIKCTEMLHNLDAENYGVNQKPPLVGLSGMSEGVTITRTGNNSVEIAPKSQFSSKLKEFADLKRQAEKENQPAPKETHDIKNETLTVKEDKNEESK
jgi:hypothetical protein